MQIEARMDAGPILMQRAEPIQPSDTAAMLAERLADLGAELLCQAIDQVARKTVRAIRQDEHLATYAPKLFPADTHLDWIRDARTLDCLIRGLCPDPGAVTGFSGRRVKVLEATVEAAADFSPGTVGAVDQKKGILVAAGSGGLWLTRVQPENRRAMAAAEFARGYRVRTGDVFGSR